MLQALGSFDQKLYSNIGVRNMTEKTIPPFQFVCILLIRRYEIILNRRSVVPVGERLSGEVAGGFKEVEKHWTRESSTRFVRYNVKLIY
jgi:hypothetical protein